MTDSQVPSLLYRSLTRNAESHYDQLPSTYEVIISITMALILLPFNFWFAAVLALLAGLTATALELRA